MILDDTRGGLDASSLHRVTSMVNYKAKKFELLSCNRDTYNNNQKQNKIAEKEQISQLNNL